MLIVIISCALLIAITTVIHYEILGMLNARLPALAIPKRTKLLVVMFTAFVAHALEIGFYGICFYSLSKYVGVGSFRGVEGFSLTDCLYFSTETYTSLGFGDLTPVGPIRLLAGVEALNGLLLIGWSVSYAYIGMVQFWSDKRG